MKTFLLATLLLHPVLAEDADLRVAATGVEGHEVLWVLDGTPVATTTDRQAATIHVPAGTHLLAGTSNATGWIAMARPDPATAGARYVDAWTARTPDAPVPDGQDPPTHPAPAPAPRLPLWVPLAAGLLLAAATLVSPKQP